MSQNNQTITEQVGEALQNAKENVSNYIYGKPSDEKVKDGVKEVQEGIKDGAHTANIIAGQRA